MTIKLTENEKIALKNANFDHIGDVDSVINIDKTQSLIIRVNVEGCNHRFSLLLSQASGDVATCIGQYDHIGLPITTCKAFFSAIATYGMGNKSQV